MTLGITRLKLNSVKKNTVTIYFVRHGKTVLNTLDKVQGWCDSSLTPEGVEVVQKTAERLSETIFHAVYSSDMIRTRETTEIIMAKNPSLKDRAIQFLPQLREVHFGKYENANNSLMWSIAVNALGVSSIKDLPTVDGYMWKSFHAMAETDETGNFETQEDVLNRLWEAVSIMIDQAPDNEDVNILAVSHSAAIRTIIQDLVHQEIGEIENAGVVPVQYYNDQFKRIQ